VSFAASLFAMKVMVGVVRRRRLGWFALYCVGAGLLAITLATR
jgi:undecaprenyl pyrophosphate phosphatase UppP